MALVATLIEAKAWIRYGGGTTEDAKLTDILSSASEWVEWKIGGPLAVTSITERTRTKGWAITPLKRPLVAVVSITPDYGTALDASCYIEDTTTGLVMFRRAIRPCWATMVYTAGLSTIPYKVKNAGLELLRHLWLTQNGSSGRGRSDDDIPVPMGFAVPRRVDELLNAGHSVGGFA